MEAGLPNITGILYQGYNDKNSSGLHGKNANPTGAFYKAETNTRYAPSTSEYSGAYTPGFDASRSNPIYGNSDTVQPKAHIVIYWKRIE